jgi:hypothetical protein
VMISHDRHCSRVVLAMLPRPNSGDEC